MVLNVVKVFFPPTKMVNVGKRRAAIGDVELNPPLQNEELL